MEFLLIFVFPCRTGGGSGQIQVQDEAEVSLELIEERETAIRQLEVGLEFKSVNVYCN